MIALWMDKQNRYSLLKNYDWDQNHIKQARVYCAANQTIKKSLKAAINFLRRKLLAFARRSRLKSRNPARLIKIVDSGCKCFN